MIPSSVATVLLYFAIIATSLLLRERKLYIFGAILIGTCLLFIELPDVTAYKEHYELTKHTNFSEILSLSNFEPGYVVVVALLSQILPFEIFYVAVVAFAIHIYFRFFEKCANNNISIYAIIFLSIFLYFIAFTLRTTIASIFLAYSILYLKNNKNFIAAVLIVFGATFHIAIAPLIILPILSRFSNIITKHFIFLNVAVIAVSVILAQNLSLDYIVGINDILDLKITAYETENVYRNGFFFDLWIVVILGSFISFKYLNEFDRFLITAFACIIFLSQPFGFIQGRLMWLTSFVFAYMFTKVFISRLNFGRIGRLFFLAAVPLAIFLRF